MCDVIPFNVHIIALLSSMVCVGLLGGKNQRLRSVCIVRVSASLCTRVCVFVCVLCAFVRVCVCV